MVKLATAESDCIPAGTEIVAWLVLTVPTFTILFNRWSHQMLAVTTVRNFLNSFGGFDGESLLLWLTNGHIANLWIQQNVPTTL